MRLADFITAHREAILVEWDAFARTCSPASGGMDIDALRDHASEMLTVIIADLKSPQHPHEQSEKSKGKAPDEGDASPTAAEEHGADRAESGFTVEQMVSEYRALRASVLRLWAKDARIAGPEDIADITRFNEAIDQSLAESVTRYTGELERSKEMFLAILGHDLRTPLGAVNTAAKYMLETGELTEPHLTLTSRIASSSTRMNNMVGDLLDFTRSRLGGGIPIERTSVCMDSVIHDIVNEISAAHPGRTLEVNVDGDQNGMWDCPRVTQAFTNLIGNALQHGSDGSAVTIDIRGGSDDVTIAIHNDGIAIPEDKRATIFDPMKHKTASGNPAASGPSGNLGLGLYIAERIVHAHNGTIDLQSSTAGGTTFTVHLPRAERPDA